jgi:thioesterase domain-containing protein
VIVHPGGLSAACWSRLAALLPAGTSLCIEELETIHAFWSDGSGLTVEALAARLPAPAPGAVLVGWGVGGAVADALAARARPRHVIVLDAPAPGAPEPDEPELLRRFAMYLGARRGATPELTGDLLATASMRRGFDMHVRRERRDHRLTAAYVASGQPLTVVKAVRSMDARPALGWDAFGPVEVLASGGDHYSMLTDPAAAAGLAMLLARWLVRDEPTVKPRRAA